MLSKYHSREVVQSVELMLHYLAPLCDAVETLMSDYIDGEVRKWRSIRQTLVVIFVVLIGICYVFLLKKAISRLEKKKQLTRSMLLMIPLRAISVAESLRKAISDLILH